MGIFDSGAGQKPEQQDAVPQPSVNPRETSRSRAVPVDGAAARADPAPPSSSADKRADAGGAKDGKPGFLRSHFGDPEAGEVYGTSNDYETEEQQIADEKVAANQSLWYIGVFTVLVFLGYLFFT